MHISIGSFLLLHRHSLFSDIKLGSCPFPVVMRQSKSYLDMSRHFPPEEWYKRAKRYFYCKSQCHVRNLLTHISKLIHSVALLVAARAAPENKLAAGLFTAGMTSTSPQSSLDSLLHSATHDISRESNAALAFSVQWQYIRPGPGSRALPVPWADHTSRRTLSHRWVGCSRFLTPEER